MRSIVQKEKTMKKRELRSRILAKYDTFKDFADDMGVSNVTVAHWASGNTLPCNKIPKACELLGIKSEDIGKVFFPEVGRETA